jgi:hypothetical protein
MTGSVNVPALLYVREFDETEKFREHAMTALPDVTRPISLTAIPLRFGFLIVALTAVTANWPLTDFDLTTFHVAVVPVALAATANAATVTTIDATYFIVWPPDVELRTLVPGAEVPCVAHRLADFMPSAEAVQP